MRLFLLMVGLLGWLNPHYGQFNLNRTLTHQELERQYVIHFPPGYSGMQAIPVVLFLHGGSGNAQSAQGFTGFNQVANRENFLVVYPQGYTEVSSNSYVWADGRGTAADRAGIDDVGFLSKLIDTLLINYTIDPERIYLCGYSNGSFLTQRMAFEGNEPFAAMGTLGSTTATFFIEQGDPGRPIPMFFLFGTEDPFVPYEGGIVALSSTDSIVGIEESVAYWRQQNDCRTALPPEPLPDLVPDDSSTVTVFRYTDCACNQSEVVYYRVDGAGHTWPGIELPAYEFIAGQTNEDILASQELWDFFREYTRCETTVSATGPYNNPQASLFPNPTARSFSIQMKNTEARSVSVYSSTGQLMVHFSGPFRQKSIAVNDWAPGLYVIRIQTKDDQIVTFRLVRSVP